MMSLKFDATNLLNNFQLGAKNSKQVISNTMNNVAFNNTRYDIAQHKKEAFEIKKGYVATPNSTLIQKSNRDNLSVTFTERQAWWGLQQDGGTETAKNKYQAVPITKGFAILGVNTKTKAIPKRYQINNVYNASKTGKKIGKYSFFALKSGIFFRNGGNMQMLYAFKKTTKHTAKKLTYDVVIMRNFSKDFSAELEKKYVKVLNG